MALIFEDSAKVTKKQIPIPQNTKKVFKAMKKIYEPFLDKNIPGSKILKSLGSDKKYNKKGTNSKSNGDEIKQDTVNVNDAKVRLHRMNKLPKNSIEYQLNGGELAANLYKKGIERARGVQSVDAVKPPKPTANVSITAPKMDSKEISVPNGKITYSVTAENRIIKEDIEDNPYYEYLMDYDAYYVLEEFFANPNGTQDWGVLINPNMYKKALNELSRFGKLTNSTFPSKYVYQWMGIIMKNTAILRANTDLAGHSNDFPGYEVAEYAERIDGIEIGTDFSEGSEWLEEKGLYDWMKMPDGSDAWSDYGLEPLEKIFLEYDENLPPEKVLVLVNRAIDVYHQRGDMTSIFIQGGTKALLENTKKKNRKIYISESQVINLNYGKHNRKHLK